MFLVYSAEQEINFLRELYKRRPDVARKIAIFNLSGRRWDAGVNIYHVEVFCADLIAGRL